MNFKEISYTTPLEILSDGFLKVIQLLSNAKLVKFLFKIHKPRINFYI